MGRSGVEGGRQGAGAYGPWTRRDGSGTISSPAYPPEIRWHLVVERDTSELVAEPSRQILVTVVIAVILAAILFIITTQDPALQPADRGADPVHGAGAPAVF